MTLGKLVLDTLVPQVEAYKKGKESPASLATCLKENPIGVGFSAFFTTANVAFTSLLTLNTVQSIMNGDYQAAAGWCAGTLYANFLMGSIASQVAISGQERAYDIDRINFEHQGFSIDMY